jgi:hypothetical protein
MTATAKSVCMAMVMGAALAATAASAAATHKSPQPQPQPEASQRPATVQQEPEKRQNFRGRRADEIPPWAGFEDCPMAFPCVGMVGPHGRRN